jgi:hypothetical protein
MNNNFTIDCSTCGRNNRKRDKCKPEFLSECDEFNNYKFWRPSPKLMNQINQTQEIQQELQLYKTAFEMICKDEEDCPSTYLECKYSDCNLCCENYYLEEAKRLSKKEE